MQLPTFSTSTSRVKIYAGKLFDSTTGELVPHQVITIDQDSGLIVDVSSYDIDIEVGIEKGGSHVEVDLKDKTVLPGFVDCHVHLFLHPYSETSWEDQVTRESLAERTIRATAHARKTLMAGYTAVRDLGTEGAEDADISLRECLSGPNPIIPGPRYFTANRAIVTTGSYGPKNKLYPNRDGVEGIMGAEVADGVDGCVRAVRRQIGAGADWIKIYADYRVRARLAGTSRMAASESLDTFSEQELGAMIQTAHSLGVKVAAHTSGNRSWDRLTGKTDSAVQMDSVEHAYGIHNLLVDTTDSGRGGSLSNLDKSSNTTTTTVQDVGCTSASMLLPGEAKSGDSSGLGSMARKTTWVPTLAAYYTLGRNTGQWQQAAESFKTVIQHVEASHIKIACGGDTGVFSHGDNALEMKLMVQLGADWRQVLSWGTLGGWECIRSLRWEGQSGERRLARVGDLEEDARVVGDNEVPFGVIKRGFAADIIATDGDLQVDFEGAVDKRSIVFVMKGGRIYKHHGRELGLE